MRSWGIAVPKLPNVEMAWVDEGKLLAYLLSPIHESGRHKARFLFRFGFLPEEWQTLRDSLLIHARTHDAQAEGMTDFGAVFRVVGPLASPDGRNPMGRVVSMVRNDENFPRLVTLVPLEPPEP